MTSTAPKGVESEDVTPETNLKQMVDRALRDHRTAEEQATSVIRNAIVAGVFKSGERLPQDRLARLLGVSRMPIRAGLRQLESEGLVETHAHRGATVRTLTPEEISDLYELRILVETFALKKTVRAINDEQLEKLEGLTTDLEDAPDHESWMLARQRFYHELYTIGNTPRVVTTIMQFRGEVSRYTHNLGDPRSQTHFALLERIRMGDPDLAAAWLEAHLRHVAQERRHQVRSSMSNPEKDPPADGTDQ